MTNLLKPRLSTVLVAVFFLILVFLGLFAEVFESESPEVDLAQIYANPIPVAEIQQLKTMKITNKQGQFDLMNTHPESDLAGPWQMTSPQSLRVKPEVIRKIVDAFNVIRVRNFHRLEPINLSSYSLDNPTLTLHLTNAKNKSFEIKMGLINPIDNSTYMTISTQDQIYQIDPIEIQLESYDLAQIVDNKIFALNTGTIISFEILGQNNNALKLVQRDGKWFSDSGVELSTTKIERFFERLEAVKSSSILENITQEQKEYLDRATAVPSYSIKIGSPQGLRTYILGEVKGGIPGTNVLGTVFVLTNEERKSYMLIDREQTRALGIKLNDLK